MGSGGGKNSLLQSGLRRFPFSTLVVMIVFTVSMWRRSNLSGLTVFFLGAWLVGGIIAMIGAFIYAELAARRPQVGGQYAYLRECYHPLIAFLFGWSLFLISDCGGMAAVAVIFARYYIELTGVPLSETLVAILALGVLTIVNCLGVRTGSTVQNILMVTKIMAILLLVGLGVRLIV